MLASVGITIVPSFIGCSSKSSLLFKNIAVTQDQEALLALIAETIIPKTDSPGAIETSTQAYTAKMIDDCMTKKDQEKWLAGLNQFVQLSEKENSNGFAGLTSSEREKFLTQFSESKEENVVNFFYKNVRRLTLRGYTTSEYFLTKQNFSLIPGHFKGCVPVSNPS